MTRPGGGDSDSDIGIESESDDGDQFVQSEEIKREETPSVA